MNDNLLSSGGLSLERLRSFLLVVDAGSITKACKGDVVKQSQYSRQIRELEAFFGAELTRRQGRQLVITPHGRRLAEIIRACFLSMEDFRREMADEPRSFAFGAGGSVLDWMLAPIFPKLKALLPAATWRLENHRSAELVTRVADGRLDFAVVRGDAIPAGLPKLNVSTRSYVAVLPKSLAKNHLGKTSLTLAELSRLPLAVPGTEGQLHEALASAFAKAKVAFRPTVHCEGSLQVHALVSAGSCAAVLPSVAPLDGLLVFQLPQLASYRRTMVLHWNRRQLEKRAIDPGVTKAMARLLKHGEDEL
jgi:DNA-binding transcriptional LysR family regulator